MVEIVLQRVRAVMMSGTSKINLGVRLKQQIVDIFRAEAHNMRHNRVGLSLIPGKPVGGWEPDDAAEAGHLGFTKAMHERGRSCTVNGANRAAYSGCIEMIRFLDRKSTRLNSSH